MANCKDVYDELTALLFPVEIEKSHGASFEVVFLNSELRAVPDFQNNNKYRFFLKSERMPYTYKTNIDIPLGVSIGKATKKKIQAWLNWAKLEREARNKFWAEYNERFKESKAKFESFKHLPGVKIYEQGENIVHIDSKHFSIRLEIREADANIDSQIRMKSSYYNEDLFAELIKAGF